MPLLGHPDALLDAAEQLSRAARRLADVQGALAAHAREVTTTATWSGTAAPLAAARLAEHPAAVGRAADAAAQAVAPLRAFAEELRAAQRDHALGEQMVGDGEAAYAAVGSGAVAGADAAREAAAQTVTDGANVMNSAEERMRAASERAARALEAATALLAGIAPPERPPPLVGGDELGTLPDGVRKALIDEGNEVATTATGLAAHVNPFSGDFGPAWSNTWSTITAALSHPVDAASTMVSGTVAPIGDSYRSGGVDEAVGRAPAVVAGIVGLKGLTKLDKLRLLRGEDSTPLAPGGGLQRHEDAGGHTLDPEKAHVGATRDDTFRRLQDSPPHVTGISSYFDRQIAERSVAETIGRNQSKIDDWLQQGGHPPLRITTQHDQAVGHRLAAGATGPDQAVNARGSRVVLKADPNMPGGYHILTSFPVP